MKLLWILPVFLLPSENWAAKVTVDDLMRLRSLFDVRISPDGKSVAYVVSTLSIERAEHEAALWLVSSMGGTHGASPAPPKSSTSRSRRRACAGRRMVPCFPLSAT